MRYIRVTLPHGASYFVTNQTDAKQIADAWAARGETKIEVEDVPTDREGLIEWINRNCGAPSPASAADGNPATAGTAPGETQARCPNCKRTHAEAERIASLTQRSAILEACTDHILAGDANLLAALAGVVIVRLQELKGALT